MSFFTKIFETGVTESNPFYLNEKIKITNAISSFLAILSIPFAIFTYYLFPEVTYLPVIFFIVMVSNVFVNQMGLFNLSRFILIVGTTSIYTIYHCYLMPDDQKPQGALYALNTLFFILPWIVIDFREKALLTIYNLFNIVILASIPTLNPYFSYDIDISLLQDGYLFYLFIFTFGAGSCISFYFLSNGIFTSEIKNNNLIQEFNEKNKALNDNENRLNTYISEIQKAQEEEKKRTWAADGMAQFVEILRSNNSELLQLSDTIISKLVNYLKVNQGSIFVLNEENDVDPFLELTAVYAYDRKRFVEKRIDIGQGMVGQSFLEKDVIFLKKVPQDYVHITSGLGQATPTGVIIVPLVINEKAFGVIELASFRQFENFEIDFLKKLGENIAGTLANVRVNEKTMKLLTEAQLSQEQLRAQEEEVRQNMEELQATQEELARKSEEIEELRIKERERADAQISSQRKIMEQFAAKAKQKEEELLARVAELEAKLISIN